MNLESNQPKKSPVISTDDFSMDDFDFKPITSGLGFNQGKVTTEIKPAFIERPMPQSVSSSPVMKKEMSSVYQNDLSLFYGQTAPMTPLPAQEIKEEKVYKTAPKTLRVFAYILDLLLVCSILGLVLTLMSRLIDMDLMDAWNNYPNEITPLVVTLFCGFYLIYFAIFEKTSQSTLGKAMLNLRVVNEFNENQTFTRLLVRSFISLVNVVSLGLFSYFDLQNKVTASKVIRND